MKKLWKYEFLKFIYHKKNVVVILAMASFLIGFIIYHHQLDQAYPKMMQDTLWDVAEYANKQAKSMGIMQTNLPEGKQYDALEEQKDFWLNVNNISLILVSDYTYDNYQTMDFVKSDKAWNTLLLKGMVKGYSLDNVTKDTKKTIQEKVLKDEYILKNKTPIPHSPYECTFLNLFDLVFSGYSSLILLFFFVLLMFDISTIEFENGTYKVMYSSEYSMMNIIVSKLLFTFFIAIIFLLFLILVFAFAGILFGFGSPHFPYPVYPAIFRLSNVVMLMLLLYLIALFTVNVIVLFISYYMYSSSVVLVTMITAYMMMIVFQQIFDFQWLYPYIPICFLYNKEIIQEHGSIICIGIGISVSLLLVTISVKRMKRRDILL